MHKILLAFFLLLSISACGGGGGGGGSNNNNVGAVPTLSGTAATGVAIEGVVNVYGSNGGSILDAPISPSGMYSVDVSGLTAPYLIVAVPDNPTLASQYSYADGPGIANITPLTTLALFYANSEQDPALLINTWQANQASVSANLPAAQATVNANFVGVFDAINAALDIDFTTYDFFITGFAIGGTFDQILDLLGLDLSGGTPDITVDGNSFPFDPTKDTSGINIGGGSGGGTTGSLMVSGADTPVIGTSFTPTVQTGTAGSTTAIVWGNIDAQISVGGNGSQLSVVTFNFARATGNGQIELYSYGLVCGYQGDDCSKLQLDLANKQAKFTNLVMPLSGNPNNSASAPITLNGTLTWGAAPSITSFTAASTTITAGDSVDLTAVFTDGSGSIDNGVGAVTSSVPVSVSPSVTTTYTLTVSNQEGSVTSDVTIVVDISGGTTDFGSLSVSGTDTAVIGTGFAPVQAFAATSQGITSVQWDEADFNREVVLRFSNSQLIEVQYFFVSQRDGSGTATEVYAYDLLCEGKVDADCPKVGLDENNKQLTLGNVTLMPRPRIAPGPGTAPIILNGTLNY